MWRRRRHQRRVQLCAYRVEGMVGVMKHIGEEGREDAWTWARLPSTKRGIVPVKLFMFVSSVYLDLRSCPRFYPGIVRVEILPIVVGIAPGVRGRRFPVRRVFRYRLLFNKDRFSEGRAFRWDVRSSRRTRLGGVSAIESGRVNPSTVGRTGWRLRAIIRGCRPSPQARRRWRVLGHRKIDKYEREGRERRGEWLRGGVTRPALNRQSPSRATCIRRPYFQKAPTDVRLRLHLAPHFNQETGPYLCGACMITYL